MTERNPYQPPRTPVDDSVGHEAWRKPLAFVLFGIALVALVAFVVDVGLTVLALMDGRIALGLLTKSLSLMLAVGAFRWGLHLWDPENHPVPDDDTPQLVAIAKAHASLQDAPEESERFAHMTNEELVQVYKGLDRDRFPERFGGLVTVVRERVAARSKAEGEGGGNLSAP